MSTVLHRPAAASQRTDPPRVPWRIVAGLGVPYVVLIVAVVVGSPLDGIDRAVANLRMAQHLPDLGRWVVDYVVIGQRGPSAAVAGLWVGWCSWRRRSLRPLVLLVTALALLNLSVGAVKVGTGRLGPLLTTHPKAVFDGGDIFPSGHTSNAVVVFGVLAMLAGPGWRRLATPLAVVGAGTVGLSTIFLDTHWVSDVLGGWLAGGLVLAALPFAANQVTEWGRRALRVRRNPRREPHAGHPEPVPDAGPVPAFTGVSQQKQPVCASVGDDGSRWP